MNKKRSFGQIKSLSGLFEAWLSRADEKDKALAPAVRKGKWILILMVFFLLFSSSFIWLPMAQLLGHQLESPTGNTNLNRQVESKSPTFEMPVDSFENQLKQNLHENLPTKK